MILAVDAAASEANRFGRTTREGAAIWRRRYFGPEPGPTGSASVDPGASDLPGFVARPERDPQAFVVEQSAGALVHPHFHYVDQFQVAFDGSGMLGKHALAPITVHFAGAHTGYGPIRPGPQGLKYLTTRARSDTTGAQFLPAARDRMEPRPRRNLFAGPARPAGTAALAARRAPVTETLMEDGDGLGAWLVRLPALRPVRLADPGLGDGMTLWVAAGSVTIDGRSHAAGTALFLSPDEPVAEAAAGGEGGEVLVLRFPRLGAA